MKRIVQEPGIKKWAGDDLVSLQEEPMKVLDLMFKPYGACIIEGCQVVGNEIKPGIVALQGVGSNGLDTFKVVPFAGQINIASFPVYLVLAVDAQMREYVDGEAKPVAYSYYAAVSTVIPSGSNYITINTTGNRYLVDAIQDSKHRFVSDAEKVTWNAKASTAVATTVANGLLSNTDKTKLDGIAINANNYTHPATHPATMITQDTSNRFVSDTEKVSWNNSLKLDNNKAILLPEGYDLNNLNATGFFRGHNIVNAPFYDWFFYTVISHDDTQFLTQQAVCFGVNQAGNRGNIYTRTCHSSGWTPWRLVIDESNLTAARVITDANNRFVSDAEKAIWNNKVYYFKSDNNVIWESVDLESGFVLDIFSNILESNKDHLLKFRRRKDGQWSGDLRIIHNENFNLQPAATISTNGLMSSTDKTKLDRINGGKVTVAASQPSGAQLGDIWIKP